MIAESALLLVLEDDPSTRRSLRTYLVRKGFQVLSLSSMDDLVVATKTLSAHLVLLDLGSSERDGVSLTLRIREYTRAPVIVLSARDDAMDKAEVLDAGADDYVTKPFSMVELLARIRVAFRHEEAKGKVHAQAFEFGAVRFDSGRRELFVENRLVHLTPIEFRLLELFAANAGRVVPHRKILDTVWGPEQRDMTHYVTVRVASLRKKIERHPHRPTLLVTEPGVGYRLRDLPPSPRRSDDASDPGGSSMPKLMEPSC